MLQFGFCSVIDRFTSGVRVQIGSSHFGCWFGYRSESFGSGFESQFNFTRSAQYAQNMVRTTVQEDSSEAAEQMRKSHQDRGPHGLSMVGAPVHGGPHGLTMVSLVPSSPLVFLWLFVYVWQFCRLDFSHTSNFYCFIPLYSIFLSSTSII